MVIKYRFQHQIQIGNHVLHAVSIENVVSVVTFIAIFLAQWYTKPGTCTGDSPFLLYIVSHCTQHYVFLLCIVESSFLSVMLVMLSEAEFEA